MCFWRPCHLSAQGDVQLVVAGQGEEQPALEAQSVRLGLMNRVHFVGRVSGSAKTYLLQNALCMVVPSALGIFWPGCPGKLRGGSPRDRDPDARTGRPGGARSNWVLGGRGITNGPGPGPA